MSTPPWLDGTIAANEQRVQDNFSKWFGASKATGESGAPLVLFHGTNRDFAAFDEAKSGDNFAASRGAFFFSDELCIAEQIADHVCETTDDEIRGSARVLSAYLSLQNPLVVDRRGRRVNIPKLIDDAKSKDHDGIILLRALDGMPAWAANQYIAFRPDQIKSIDNCGLFVCGSSELADTQAEAALHAASRARLSLSVRSKKGVSP